MSFEDIFKQIGANHNCDGRLQLKILEDFLRRSGQMSEFKHFAEEWAKAHPEKIYNPEMENEVCECGHPYHRHFDGYEDNFHIGCKYCSCYDFKPIPKTV